MFLKFLHSFVNIFQSIKLIPTVGYVTISRDGTHSKHIRRDTFVREPIWRKINVNLTSLTLKRQQKSFVINLFLICKTYNRHCRIFKSKL